jgi:uncharacterized damage-inducible protein DinB
MIEHAFLQFSSTKLTELSARIEDCLGRLTADQVWMRNAENENSVGNIVLHLCGNVRQWILGGIGGQPDHRDRESEFAARGGFEPAELAAKLKAVISEAAQVIRNVPVASLPEKKIIQKYDTTVMEAIYHVVEHFAGHTGQIIFATKLLTGHDLGYYKHLSKGAQAQAAPATLP